MTASDGGGLGDGPVYVDSSALVKVYVAEPDSDSVDALLRRRRDLVISDLVITEIVSSAARRMRVGAISRADVRALRKAVLDDVESDRLRLVDLRSSTHRRAEGLLTTLGDVPLRAADALHLAIALESECRTMMTWDARLGMAAGIAGMEVFPAYRPD